MLSCCWQHIHNPANGSKCTLLNWFWLITDHWGAPPSSSINSFAFRWCQQWPDHIQHQPDGLPRPARLAALHPADPAQRRSALWLPHRNARWQALCHRGGWLDRCQSEDEGFCFNKCWTWKHYMKRLWHIQRFKWKTFVVLTRNMKVTE